MTKLILQKRKIIENKRNIKYGKSKVYFTKNISEEGLIKIYEALNQPLKGKAAVKISKG